MRLKELFKYLVRVIGKPVPSFQLTLCEQSFSQLFPTVLVVECSLYRVTQDLIGLWDLGEVMIGSLLVFFSEFWMPPEYFFLVALCDLFIIGVSFYPQNFVIVFHHSLDIYITTLFYLLITLNFQIQSKILILSYWARQKFGFGSRLLFIQSRQSHYCKFLYLQKFWHFYNVRFF